MGIYDREYYRDESGGIGLLSGVAPACKVIILANVLVFLAQWVLKDIPLEYWLTASVDGIYQHGRAWQLLTAAFFHVDPIHILINMWILWMFGREVEAYYGSRDFAAFYLAAAIVGTLAWTGVEALTGQNNSVMLGASGAVTATFVVYGLFHPHRQVLLFFVLPMQIWLLLTIFLVLDALMLIQQLSGGGSGGVAFAAHLGGAAFGFLFKTYDLRWSQLIGNRRRLRPRLRMVLPEDYDFPSPDRRGPAGSGPSMSPGSGSGSSSVSGRSAPGAPIVRSAQATTDAAAEALEERLDEILAKIAREGRGGLTDEENRILEEASRRARDRRSERIR